MGQFLFAGDAHVFAYSDIFVFIFGDNFAITVLQASELSLWHD